MNKNNALFGVGIAILFVILGLYLLLEKATQEGTSNPLLIKIIGIICVLFFGSLAVLGLLKFIKK